MIFLLSDMLFFVIFQTFKNDHLNLEGPNVAHCNYLIKHINYSTYFTYIMVGQTIIEKCRV